MPNLGLAERIFKFIHHCRPKNLGIVAITQFAVYALVILPIINSVGEAAVLSNWQLAFLIIDTVILAAGGYIINDIIDDPIDRINKGLAQSIIHNLGDKFALAAYWTLGAIGLGIAAALAAQTGLWNLFWLYPLSWLLLLLYARIFKKTPLFGNLIVSLFCAFVPGILLIAEWPVLFKISYSEEFIGPMVALTVLMLYILFAFLTTMVREIIKDMEDVEGDKKYNCRTLPIVWGYTRTKFVVLIFSIMLITTLGLFAISLFGKGWWFSAGWILLCLLLPFSFINIKLFRAQEKAHFTWLSQAMKWIMLSGLILLFVIRFEVL